jgi:hypothetical protein
LAKAFRVTAYLKDMNDFASVNEICETFFLLGTRLRATRSKSHDYPRMCLLKSVRLLSLKTPVLPKHLLQMSWVTVLVGCDWALVSDEPIEVKWELLTPEHDGLRDSVSPNPR